MFLKRIIAAVLLILLLLSAGACGIRPPEDLYTVPEQPATYYNLQELLASIMTDDVSFSAPVGGENLQPIQMRDLDGDGKNEAIVFAKSTGEHPLKIYILARDEEDSFRLVSELSGDGNSFVTVNYAQLDGSPGDEIVVGRSIGNQVLNSCSVYALRDSLTMELLYSNYSSFLLTDLDSDGRSDLFLLKADSESGGSSAELYRYSGGAMQREPELTVTGAGSLKRLISGYTEEGLPAVFVALQSKTGTLMTDVFVMRGDAFTNIARNVDSSSVTVRNYSVYAEDIDADGLIELPDVRTLPSDSEDDQHQIIEWYNLCSDGSKKRKLLTYHDFSHGFYLNLDPEWESGLSIESESDALHGSSYRFSCAGKNGSANSELFTLYVFTGNDGAELSQTDGRFLLLEKNGVRIAASLGEKNGALTKEDIIDRFHEIQTAWNSGNM